MRKTVLEIIEIDGGKGKETSERLLNGVTNTEGKNEKKRQKRKEALF